MSNIYVLIVVCAMWGIICGLMAAPTGVAAVGGFAFGFWYLAPWRKRES